MTPDRTFSGGNQHLYRNGALLLPLVEDDTGSPNYKVRYATATSPLGPLHIPANNIVIMKDEEREIYGTGHNSVLQVPGKDEWYIVYHRINKHSLNEGPLSPGGLHRPTGVQR